MKTVGTTLGQVLSLVIDHRGLTPKKLGGDFASTGVPVLSARHIKQGRVVGVEELRFVDHAVWDRWMPEKLQAGDVILTSEAPLGEVAVIDETLVNACLGQRVFGLRARPDQVDPAFLYYWLRSAAAQTGLAARASGTTAQGIRQTELLQVPIQLPGLPDQRAISGVLSVIDRRIELNRSVNRSLGSIASAIFRAWFVDFDPSLQRAAGTVSKAISTDLAVLFPTEFEDLKGQQIPAGWTMSTIGKETKVSGGSTPSTRIPEYWGGDHHWITPKDLSRLEDPIVTQTDRMLTSAGLATIGSGALPVGTVLLSSRAPIGYTAITGIPLATNQGFIALQCTGRLSNYYVFEWLRTNMEEILSRSGGTTFAEISKANFRPIPIVVPPPEIASAFDSLMDPMFRRISLNVRQNAILGRLRGRLLPALLSGGLVLDAIAEPVGAAVS